MFDFAVEGPHFRYELAPELFLGRGGCGPLDVVWDTNVLIDYLTFGRSLWDDQELDIDDKEYYSEVEALGLILNVWTRRDIRMHVLDASIDDAKRILTESRREARVSAVREVSAALGLDMWAGLRVDGSDEDYSPASPIRSLFSYSRAFASLPTGKDRQLVSEAVRIGAHVFLTRDKGVLACKSLVAPYGLLVVSPLDLLEELSRSGAVLSVIRPETMYWPLPDLQRISHLIGALPPD